MDNSNGQKEEQSVTLGFYFPATSPAGDVAGKTSQTEADKNLRLGFGIDNFDQTVLTLKELQIPFSLEPTQTNFGFMAIISDPDERKIELYKK